MNQHSQALAVVRRVLASSPNDSQALKLESDIRHEIQTKGIGLPKGQSPYARAKRAQLADQDLGAAESLFRLAIQQEDKAESAVKDLASLLQQQGRVDDAISLLSSRRRSHKGVSPYDNMLATLYQHLGRHDEALQLLEGLLRGASHKDKPTVLRRIAFSQFQAARYDDSERTLRNLLSHKPADRIAERWLAGLEEARRIGSYAGAEEIIGALGGLAEEGLELSPLARDAIDGCSFEGVDPSKLQSGALTPKDVERLEDLAKQLGTKRPRDRAAYYLSAAAILARLGLQDETARVYDYLRRHFASMGDGAWVDKRPADVVRTYYLESLALVSDPQLDEAWRTLVRYLGTFAPDKLDALENSLPKARRRGTTIQRAHYVAALQVVLKSIEGDCFAGLLDASAQSGFVSQATSDAFATDTDLRVVVTDFLGINRSNELSAVKDLWSARYREIARNRQHCISVCHTLTRHQLTAASMEELCVQLRGIAKVSLGELDRLRVADLLDVAESAVGFCRASDFEDKEQHYWLVTTHAQRCSEQIRLAPTQFSFDGLLPLAEQLRSLTEEEYAQVARTSAAALDLRLLVDQYVPGRKGEVRLQVEMTNRAGCSPASSVFLILGPSDSPYFEIPRSDHEIAATLRGGSSTVARVALTLRERASAERAFPIKARARYRNRVGEDCWTEERDWTVRLYSELDFRPIVNRYAPYAEGGPVDDPQMFVGRDDLLNRLEGALLIRIRKQVYRHVRSEARREVIAP